MSNSQLEKQVKSYESWKSRLKQTVLDYQEWLEKFKLNTKETDQEIRRCINELNSEKLNITFVAEFSRGKTELINSMFFADYGKRLLPSSAGRTTMCPTELFYDKDTNHSYVRLLPIETRLQETTLLDLKQERDQWVTYPLDPNSVEQMEETLKEVIKTRRVTLKEAVRLGLYSPEIHDQRTGPPTHVEIPRWRHALISFPHPLLQQGLSILDTPGLNALGSEPELTLSMLPSSQAILFVLAADTGVTKSDLEMWQNHIKGFHSKRQRGLMVVLNKIDTLWDELLDSKRIDKIINKQVTDTSNILGVKPDIIFPVSAQKALLAKVKTDEDLLMRSQLKQLEYYISHEILDQRQKIVQETIVGEISNMVENSYGVVAAKLNRIKVQMDELTQLNGKSHDVIEHMMDETRKNQDIYLKNVNSFQASHKVLKDHSNDLLRSLDLDQLKLMIEKTEETMKGNWTTMGLKNNMKNLFDNMRDDMQAVIEKSEQTRKLIRSIYRHFQTEHDFSVSHPKMISLMPFRVKLEMLYQEAEVFRNSPVTAVTGKTFVVKRFFQAIVTQAIKIFEEARQEADSWVKIAMEPLIYQIRDHKEHMEQHLHDLQNISQSKDTLKHRIEELNTQYQAIARQLTLLRNLHAALNNPTLISEETPQKPRLVSDRKEAS